MVDPKPITLVSGENPNPDITPQPFVVVGGVPAGEVTSADITDASAVGTDVLTATDAAAARTAIGAGTSSLSLGTTGATAAAGDHTHTFASLSGSVSGATGATLQAILNDLASRITALEP